MEDPLESFVEQARIEIDRVARAQIRPIAQTLIGQLVAAISDRPGPGRPPCPKVNGDRLRALRIKAKITQEDMVNEIRSMPGGMGFSVKSVRRYEGSGSADPSKLEAIAAVLSKRLCRPVTVDELLF